MDRSNAHGFFYGRKQNIMNIVLIGYRCSGKTSVGKIIAEKMNRIFVDTDKMIEEKTGSSIEEIVSREGWEYFRDIEKVVVEEVSSKNNLVIATGGGIVMKEDNMENLKEKGFIVWLKGDADILSERMEKDHGKGIRRPSLTGENPAAEIRRVLEIRDTLYEKAGDFIVDTNRISFQEVAELIIKEILKTGGA